MILNLIKNVIIPEKIGNYYLIPQRVLGLDITKTGISGTQVYYSGKKIIIEKFINLPLETDATPYAQRITEAIKAMVKQADRADIIHSSLASSFVIFKELTVPFSDPEKIGLVLLYELEPHLPFPIGQAIADFIIIQTNPETKSCTILAAAVKKEYVQEQLSYFQQAGLDPAVVSVDLFDLYSLFKFIPSYNQEQRPLCLIEFGFSAIRIAYIAQGNLNAIRTIPRGLSSIIKELSLKLNITPTQAHEKIIRFGLDANADEQYSKAIKECMHPLLQDLSLTFESFVTRFGQQASVQLILLLGIGAEISGISRFMQTALSVECKHFDSNALLKNPAVTMTKANGISNENVMSLSTALITPITAQFNLRKQEFAIQQKGLFLRQFFVSIGLLIILFISLLTNTWWQLTRLHKELKNTEQEIITTLRKSGITEEKTLKKAMDDAQSNIEEQENIWYAFSSQTRFPFLYYLATLSTAIDRVSIDLKLNKLAINEKENTIILEGQVNDFDALKVLERELRQSNLFVYVPSLQTIKFNITLPLKKIRED